MSSGFSTSANAMLSPNSDVTKVGFPPFFFSFFIFYPSFFSDPMSHHALLFSIADVGNLSGYLNALRGSPASAAALCTCIIAWYLEGTPAQRDAIDRLSQQLWLQQTTNNVAIPVPTVANPAVVLPTVANPVAVLPTVAAPPIVAHEEPPVPVLVPLNNPPFNIGECAICFEESCPVPVFCAQCQRAAMCAQCAVLIADSTARCPFCRGPMTPP
eukprot:CAMPEP_0177661704 /NCGR_PEP_ID=MMETSP0447-20121125/18851_1 /TAXON_ID=0 /ORGANISM="Stygamoeba regulata, Strain BSH-02190019" /LENGTH=213 /DNA_ID=CAMNT_0019167125 /DNA_START=571 /DNA_END=1212 /DNA_ORIENTATION=-